mmetsp:Transcript_11411/g.30190  ORF Transcript_11411/g.30190 Transcript_11411/m.30190 type:complete len:267 (-) Transcript_11411:439-1239(-)
MGMVWPPRSEVTTTYSGIISNVGVLRATRRRRRRRGSCTDKDPARHRVVRASQTLGTHSRKRRRRSPRTAPRWEASLRRTEFASDRVCARTWRMRAASYQRRGAGTSSRASSTDTEEPPQVPSYREACTPHSARRSTPTRGESSAPSAASWRRAKAPPCPALYTSRRRSRSLISRLIPSSSRSSPSCLTRSATLEAQPPPFSSETIASSARTSATRARWYAAAARRLTCPKSTASTATASWRRRRRRALLRLEDGSPKAASAASSP